MRGALAAALLVLATPLAGCLATPDDGAAADPASRNATDGNVSDGSSPGANASQREAPREGNRSTGEDDDGANRTREGNATAGQGSGENGTAVNESGPAPGTVVAEGHIRAGSWTSSNLLSTASITDCAVEEAESFCMQDPPPNATVETRTETPSPRFNVDLWFHNDTAGFLGGCDEGRRSPAGGAGDEANCTVPGAADWGTVDATFGVDLDVQVVVAAAEEGSG